MVKHLLNIEWMLELKSVISSDEEILDAVFLDLNRFIMKTTEGIKIIEITSILP